MSQEVQWVRLIIVFNLCRVNLAIINNFKLKMPPKKKVEVEKKVILGRASNTLKMGLVGLPNVGKSSTFNVLSNLSVPAENYPFCTIEPEEAKVYVPDQRFEWLCEQY